MQNEIKYPLALTMIPDIGAITARKLIAYIGSPEGIFSENPSILSKVPGIGPYLAGQIRLRNFVSEAEEEISNMERNKISAIYYQDPDYPWRLKNCEDGPLLMFYKGVPDFSRTRVISVVGTRTATGYGREICRSIISDLSCDFPDTVIVSGLAYGIDITAHRSALENGLDTFAVLAHGLTTIYPFEHRSTAEKILSQGALLTDFHSKTKPERNNFLRRNRIIAGLAEATVVVESGAKGGALVTADIASSYSREVFAIPGRADDRYSSGCNSLVKKNIAALVESAADIAELLNWESESVTSSPAAKINLPLTDDEETILTEISNSPGIGQEILCSRTGIPLNKLLGTLLQMELRNWITVLPGNLYKARVKIGD